MAAGSLLKQVQEAKCAVYFLFNQQREIQSVEVKEGEVTALE